MTEKRIITELRAGIAAARPFLLSHHEPHEYHRCHRVSFLGRTVHLCARCSGIYPGIVLGLVAAWADVGPWAWPAVVLTLPAFALVDWAATTFRSATGTNRARTATGTLLGLAYGLGAWVLLVDGELWVLSVGLAYGAIAALLLALAHGVAPFAQRYG